MRSASRRRVAAGARTGCLALSVRLLFSIALALVLAPAPGRAHTPHEHIYELEVSPEFDADRTLYVVVRGNLLRSRDGGTSWQRLIQGLDHAHILSALEIAPSRPATVYAASLGDGVFVSRDGGTAWARTDARPGSGVVTALAVSPASPDRLLAVADGALHLSIDAGASWTEVGASIAGDAVLAFAADGERAALGDASGRLLHSLDGGSTWAPVAVSLDAPVSALGYEPGARALFVATRAGGMHRVDPDEGRSTALAAPPGAQPVTGLALSPAFATDDTLWISTERDGLLRSTDRGQTWQACSTGLTTVAQALEFGAPDFTQIEAPGANGGGQDVFVAGFEGLFTSRRGGCLWTELPILSTVTITGLGVSPDYANDRTVGVGTYLWGVYLSRDGGERWAPSWSGMYEGRLNGISRNFDVAFSPDYARDGTLFSYTWWLLVRSTDRGEGWEQLNPGAGGYSLALSPAFAEDDTLYLSTMLGLVMRSTDRGETTAEISRVERPASTIALSPDFARDRTVFVGQSGAISRSTDGGLTWAAADAGVRFPPFVPDQPGPRWERELDEQLAAVHLALSPAFGADGVLFAGTAIGLFRSADRGDSWTQVFPAPGGEQGIVEAVAVSPDFANDGVVLLSVRGQGHYRSLDGGRTFAEIAPGLIASNVQLAHQFGFPLAESAAIEFSPSFTQDGTIFGFAGASVYRSEDQGETWAPFPIPEPRYDASTKLRLRALHASSSRAVIGGLVLVALAIAGVGIGAGLRAETSRGRLAWTAAMVSVALAAAAFAAWVTP